MMQENQKQPFPENAVRGKPQNPIQAKVSGNLEELRFPDNVRMGSLGLVAAWPHAITLHEPEEGRMIACWPEGVLKSEPEPFFAAPLLMSESIAVVTEEGRAIVFLHPENLKERSRLALRDIDDLLDEETIDVIRVFPSDEKNIIALVRSEVSLWMVTISTDGELGDFAQWPFEQAPLFLGSYPGGYLAATDEGVIRLPIDEAQEAALYQMNEPIDTLWVNPNGTMALVAGEGNPYFSLLRFDAEESPIELVLEGMIVPATEEHYGGWVFWDKQRPTHLMPRKLEAASAVWLDGGRYLVIGELSGDAAIIDPGIPKALKLMTPPDKPFFPIAEAPPDAVHYFDGERAFWLKMDWRYGNEAPETKTSQVLEAGQGKEEASKREETIGNQDKKLTENPSKPLIILAILAAALLLAALSWWLSQSST